MEACEAVGNELTRVLTKFTGAYEQSNRVLGDLIENFNDLKSSIAEGKYYKRAINVYLCCCIGKICEHICRVTVAFIRAFVLLNV